MSDFLLSFELLYLINWLLKNEKSRLKLLVKQAVKNGLAAEIYKLDESQKQPTESLQNGFLDFIAHLEDTLLDHLETTDHIQGIRDKLLTSLNELNISHLDSHTLLTSLRQAEEELSKNSQKDSKRVLLKTIFNNWSPTKKEVN
ncbi:hypothetical protein KAW80_00705 [Candidatus Babeliales bacterium]|nr:hypothetical protein [Candidatus Babeliales bacterium]